MSSNHSEDLTSKLTYGCEDKAQHGEKCHKCIYNTQGERKVRCIFSEIE